MADLKNLETHFEFGRNWADYAATIDAARIRSSTKSLQKLFPDGISGTFLDIGCGSGIHSRAALSLGASQVTATDLDASSVSTARHVLSREPANRWEVKEESVFDMNPKTTGQFDVVYSWGVLHHTGDMWRAIDVAASLVKPGGRFAVAIYSTTTLDSAWRLEKLIYSRSPRVVQFLMRGLFIGALFSAQLLRGRNPLNLVTRALVRGMNFTHDIHDWMGGYPYETATADKLHDRVCAVGFTEERSFRMPPSSGIFGSSCHEFVFRRNQ